MDAYLLDVRKRLDQVDQEVAHRLVARPRGHPCPAVLLILRKGFQTEGLIICNGAHAQSSECLTGRDFDGGYLRELLGSCSTNHPASQPDRA
jgi:hypothetical protein